jgi:hypothetical protein
MYLVYHFLEPHYRLGYLENMPLLVTVVSVVSVVSADRRKRPPAESL